MNSQPPFDRGIFIPIGISILSIAGISLILLITFLDKPEATTLSSPTPIPFKYLLLATETSIPSPELETTPAKKPFPGEPSDSTTPEEGFPTFGTVLTSQVNTLVNSSTQSLTITPTVATVVLSVLERYDDTDTHLEYDGDWTGETDVQNAYMETLVVSTTISSDVTFTFVGQQIIIGYLSEPGLGSISISIDDNDYILDQSAGNAWFSPQFAQGEHFVILMHESGNSVNLDYIDILGSS